MTKLLLLSIFILTRLAHIGQAIYCKNEKGNNVDYFIVYKLPKINEKGSPFADGEHYAYISGPTITGKSLMTTGWKLSSRVMSSSKTIFSKTLESVYSTPKKYTYFMYSDSPPNERTNGYRAHAKGVVVMDSISGFYFSHSIPNYPPKFTQDYEYPRSGHNNGQTAICISFDTKNEGEDIINHIMQMQINIYEQHVTYEVVKKVPNVKNLAKNMTLKSNEIVSKITSVKGESFVGISRSRKAIGDLWSETVAPYLKTDFIVETWRSGAGGPLDSNCTAKYPVNNIMKLNLLLGDNKYKKSGEFGYTEDHSKWGLSTNKKFPYACIGDVNRMKSQGKRGGGTLCIRDSNVWKTFKESVVEIQACPK